MANSNTEMIKEKIIKEALRRNIDPAFALAIAEHESGFNPNAKNFSNIEKSYGLFQINTKAHPSYKGGFNVDANIKYGMGILEDAIKKAGGDYTRAAAIYNGGVGGQNASIRKGYPKAVLSLMNKHRNNTVPNSNVIASSANRNKGVINNMNNNEMLQGQITTQGQLGVSPTSAAGLRNLVDQIGVGAAMTEQRFRENIQPSTKALLIKQMLMNANNPQALQALLMEYQNRGGNLSTLKIDLGYGDTPAFWEEGGTPLPQFNAGAARRQEMSNMALQQAADMRELIDREYNPEAVAQREQTMRDRMTAAFDRYNQMIDNLEDPRLANGGYYVDPQQISRAAVNNAVLSGYYGAPQIQSPQQIAQAQYEARIANQYGVPYQQVMQAQLDNMAMKQKLMAFNIEKDFEREMNAARTDLDRLKAEQDRIARYYELQKEAMKLQSDFEDKLYAADLEAIKAGVAPTISGSAGIYEKGMGIQGDLMKTDVGGQYDLRRQQLSNESAANVANIRAQADADVERMKLDDPYTQAEKMGKALGNWSLSTGMNPQYTLQSVEASPFGGTFFPAGSPNYTMNNINRDNQQGGLRVDPSSINPFRLLDK